MNNIILRVFILTTVLVSINHRESLATNALPDTTLQTANIEKETPPDTVSKKVHSPKKATLYSAILPGLGQAYNKKYWKIPIIYAGFGTLAYFIQNNKTEYNAFKDAYTFVLNEETGAPPNEYVDKYDRDVDKLRSIKDYYRRNLELSYILTGALYILNMVDASVDAHFFNFDVSEDLSMEIKPAVNPVWNQGVPSYAGVKLALKF
jgi:hypothetical protein